VFAAARWSSNATGTGTGNWQDWVSTVCV